MCLEYYRESIYRDRNKNNDSETDRKQILRDRDKTEIQIREKT